jgi:hypothetical protein
LVVQRLETFGYFGAAFRPPHLSEKLGASVRLGRAKAKSILRRDQAYPTSIRRKNGDLRFVPPIAASVLGSTAGIRETWREADK